jgi:hypothetical protein
MPELLRRMRVKYNDVDEEEGYVARFHVGATWGRR